MKTPGFLKDKLEDQYSSNDLDLMLPVTLLSVPNLKMGTCASGRTRKDWPVPDQSYSDLKNLVFKALR